MKILLLETPTSPHKRSRVIADICRRLRPDCGIISRSLHTMVPGLKKRGSGKFSVLPDGLRERAEDALALLVATAQPDVIITYDPTTAQLLEPSFGNIQKITKHAGSTGTYNGVRFMMLADPALTYVPNEKAEKLAVAQFILKRHVALAVHHVPAPAFKYTPILDGRGLALVKKLADSAHFAAADIEGMGPIITAVGFSFAMSDDPEDLFNVSIPLYWARGPQHDTNPWDTEELLAEAWGTVAYVLMNGLPIVFQNGQFDATQLAAYGICCDNYCLDTLVFSHAFFPSMPKSLAAQASTCLHGYKYWKDEGKHIDEKGKSTYRTPGTVEGFLTYLEYCGKDNWYTARLLLYYFQQVKHLNTAKHNYLGGKALHNFVRLMLVQNGPVMAMNWHGVRANEEGIKQNEVDGVADVEHHAAEIRMMTADPNFNFGSWQQKQRFIYDVMGAPKIKRKGPSTDKRDLATIAQGYPIIHGLVHAIDKASQARQANSRFGKGLKSWRGWDGEAAPRSYTEFTVNVTRTARLSSRKPIIGKGAGTNWQNAMSSVRKALCADIGYCLAAPDYSQADVWHMAAACGDPMMIDTVMTEGNDSHSIHAADFFCSPLEDVLRGKKNKEPWVTDYTTGIRNLVKKVVHGTNYGMGPFSMVINVGVPAARAINEKLIRNEDSREMFYSFLRRKGRYSELMQHHERFALSVATWPPERLALGCEFVQEQYLSRYPQLRNFRDVIVMDKLRQNHGQITTYGPHTFTVLSTGGAHEIRRFACSAYGQAGTAGTINNAMLRWWYNPKWQYLHEAGVNLLLQVHDENVFQVPEDKGELLCDIHQMMQVEAVYEGTKFTIPVEMDCTAVWQKGGEPWDPSMSIAETKELVRRNTYHG